MEQDGVGELSGRGFPSLKKISPGKTSCNNGNVYMYTNILIIVRNQSKELHGLRCLHDMSNPLKTKLLQLFKEKCFVTLIRVREI